MSHCQNSSKLYRIRGKIDTPNTYIHDRSLSWLGTDTSVKCGGIKLVLWALYLYDLSKRLTLYSAIVIYSDLQIKQQFYHFKMSIL